MLFMSLNLRMKSKSVMEKWLDSAPIVCATASQSQIEYHSHSGTKKLTTVTVIQMNWQQTNATHNTIDKYIHIWLLRIIWHIVAYIHIDVAILFRRRCCRFHCDFGKL